jgi:hypothetical protein
MSVKGYVSKDKTMTKNQVVQYKIRIKEQIPERWAVWFDGLSMTCTETDGTIISGPIADQAALHGLLAKIRDLNLTLISVDHDVENEE